jgi:hypothetical protein
MLGGRLLNYRHNRRTFRTGDGRAQGPGRMPSCRQHWIKRSFPEIQPAANGSTDSLTTLSS